MKNKNLISISGKAGSGKDSIGIIIQGLNMSLDYDMIIHQVELGVPFKESSGYKIVKFADTLKDIACLLLGCTRRDLEDRDFKDSVLGEEWWYYDDGCSTTPYFSGQPDDMDGYNCKLTKLTVRQFLQQLGTESLRDNLHENVHVNALFGKYKLVLNKWDDKGNNLYPSWIITDTRFTNELQAVKGRGGITIRVKRLDFSSMKDNHESEWAIDNSVFDYEIDNSGSIEDLIEEVKKILIKEEII